jgi:hypothetical protein
MVTVLQCDQPRLERAQHGYRAAEDQGRPQQQMHPERRRELDLDQGGETDNDESENQDYKDRRSVSRVLRRQIETTRLATSAYAQKTGE